MSMQGGFKSQAQKEKMQQFLEQGKITQEQYDEMERNTPSDKPLPDRLHPKK